MRKIAEIERLRAFAVIMVMFAHVSFFRGLLPPPLLQSWTGVDLFFVISGFVVSRSFLKLLPPPSPGADLFQRLGEARVALIQFYGRRVFRILPLAIVWAVIPLSCAFYFNRSGAFGHMSRYEAYSEFIAAMTFLYNYAYIFKAVPRLIGHYWSLSVEEHFYLILPLFFVFVPSASRRFVFSLAIAAFIAFLLRPLLPFQGDADHLWAWFRFASHNRFDSLFLGVALGLIELNRAPGNAPLRTKKLLMNVVSLVLAGLLWILPGTAFSGNLLSISLAAHTVLAVLLVLLASYQAGFVFEFPGKKILEAIGERSYAIYLIHLPAEWMVKEMQYRTGAQMSDAASLLLWLGVLAILVEASHRLIEKPLINYGRKVTTAKGVVPTPAIT